MPQDSEFESFLAEVHDEVEVRRAAFDGSPANADELAFAELVTDELAEFGAFDGITLCPLDRKTTKGRLACSGYFIDEEDARIDFFVSLYRNASDGDTITQTEIRTSFERAVRIFQFINNGQDITDPGDVEQTAMVTAIREACSATKEIRVFVITNATARETEEIREKLGTLDARCLIWDAKRLFRIRQSGREYESVAIDLAKFGTPEGLPCLGTPEVNCGYRTFLTLIPGKLLFQLYDEFGPRILQLNVRSFLQVRGKVNKGIRSTIINEPGRFLAYNNGITGTAEAMDCECDASGTLRIKSLRGFQVVNGGQTVATIHHTAKIDKASLDQIWVQAKIAVVDGPLMQELVSNISRFSNFQNRINDADFSSNDSFHVELEKLSERLWTPGERSRWFYERARGQYQVFKARGSSTPAAKRSLDKEVPVNQRFSKTDLAKCLNSWAQRPDIVSRGAQKNFVAFMESMAETKGNFEQNDRWYHRLIAQIILYKAAESVARKLKISAYRANVITYTVALLSYRSLQRIDLDRIWEAQDLTQATKDTLEAWMPKVLEAITASANGRNVTEWCKKLECWRHVQTIEFTVPAGLEREFAEGQPLPNVGKDASEKELKLSSEERENLATVMLVPDQVWLDIHKWGLANGNLKDFECGIAGTLVSYAAGGWAKVPSRKQIRYASEIIRKARGHVESLDRVFDSALVQQ